MRIFVCLFLFGLLFFQCQREKSPTKNLPTFQAISLLGDSLFPGKLPVEIEKDFKRKLADTRMEVKAHPKNEMAIIWFGRRLAYLGQYKKAIDVFTKGLETHPNSIRLLRHRGHRYITLREFDRAIADLSRAAVLAVDSEPIIEPDGLPNKMNIPLTTTQWNIYYHLGLAYYLNGEFEQAAQTFRECYNQSINDDILVASTDWLYMTYRRLGNLNSADEILQRIQPGWDLIENDAYYKRLLMYKGLIPPDSLLYVPASTDASLVWATQGYGVANWYFYNGEKKKAMSVYREILDGDNWAAFGYIAAEADLARILNLKQK